MHQRQCDRDLIYQHCLFELFERIRCSNSFYRVRNLCLSRKIELTLLARRNSGRKSVLEVFVSRNLGWLVSAMSLPLLSGEFESGSVEAGPWIPRSDRATFIANHALSAPPLVLCSTAFLLGHTNEFILVLLSIMSFCAKAPVRHCP